MTTGAERNEFRPPYPQEAFVPDRYATVKEPLLREFLEKFEESVLVHSHESHWRLAKAAEELAVSMGIHHSFILNLGKFAHMNGVIAFPRLQKSSHLVLDRDTFRAFAALGWGFKRIPAGTYTETVQGTHEALGEHYLRGLIHEPQGIKREGIIYQEDQVKLAKPRRDVVFFVTEVSNNMPKQHTVSPEGSKTKTSGTLPTMPKFAERTLSDSRSVRHGGYSLSDEVDKVPFDRSKELDVTKPENWGRSRVLALYSGLTKESFDLSSIPQPVIVELYRVAGRAMPEEVTPQDLKKTVRLVCDILDQYPDASLKIKVRDKT